MIKYKEVYLLGIGGSGMSSIAKYLVQQNINVAGYDQRKSFVTNQLNQDGIEVDFELSNLKYSNKTLYIYSSAISMKETGFIFNLLPSTFSDWEKVLNHYNRLELMISNLDLYFPRKNLNLPEKALLKFALLLKEVDTNLLDNSSRKDFGRPKTYEFLRTLKVSNSDIAFICKSIQNFHFFSKKLSSNSNDSSLYDICLNCGDKLLPGILLQACTLPFPDKLKNTEDKKIAFYTKTLDFYFFRYLPAIGEKALLNGDDLIKIFKIAPSPVLGEVLQNIQRAQVLGDIKTPAQAEVLAAKILQPQKQN